jgi:uncharacterized protein
LSEERIPEHLIAEIERIARLRCVTHDAAHDVLHLARVLANARLIGAAELAARRPVNLSVVEAAVWLHDIVQVPKGAGPAGEAARRSAAEARDILVALAVADRLIEAVAHAIEVHSFSSGRRATTPEAAILQDADRLDALGAIGIARLWVTGSVLGGLLYHPDDPSATDRDLDDRRYALDHIERKLLRLPELMNTDAGRAEAERRVEFVRAYRDQLFHEIASERPVPARAND